MPPEMSDEVGNFAEAMKQTARGAGESLPPGAAPVDPPPVEEPPAEAPVEAQAEAPAPPAEKKLIRIGDQTFDSEADALRYAEKLENERLYAEAYNQGIREALQQTQAPAASPPEDDNFEVEFYSNPKQTFQKMTEKAKAEALSAVRAEQAKENLWKQFEEKYPDIDRRDAELVLSQNMDTLGRVTDMEKGMDLLAKRTRAEYQRIIERAKPRTELPANRGQATVPSTPAAKSVTPQKKDDAPLTMLQQMRSLREQKRNTPA